MRLITKAVLVVWFSAGAAWAQQGNPSPSSVEPNTAPSTAGALSSSGDVADGSGPSQGSTAADTNALASIENKFENSDLTGKLTIIDEAAGNPSVKMGPLYKAAVDYLVANLVLLRTDTDAQQMGAKAAHLIGTTAYKPGAESVWQLFQLSSTDSVRLAATDALAIVAKGDSDVINKMNHWLAGQNLLHITGMSVDSLVVDGCVQALAALEDPSSFAVLFSTMEAGYGDPTTNDARNALKLLKGDRGRQLLQVVETNRYRDRPAALEMAMSDKSLSTQEKGLIATAALKGALEAIDLDQGSTGYVTTLRFDAVRALATLQWTPAAPVVLANFNRAASEYANQRLSAEKLVLSADALAAMATHEAAIRLSLYLGLINSQTAKGLTFNDSVTLAIVKDLDRIGDGVAYDNLYAIRYLDYPDSIKTAAREAVRNLAVR